MFDSPLFVVIDSISRNKVGFSRMNKHITIADVASAPPVINQIISHNEMDLPFPSLQYKLCQESINPFICTMPQKEDKGLTRSILLHTSTSKIFTAHSLDPN